MPKASGYKQEQREAYRQNKERNGGAQLPQKRFYRQRAHANPFSDHCLE
jgi:hypothetical protein